MLKKLGWAVALTAGALGGVALARHIRSSSWSLAGRVVLITGGSRGLGLILARHFADAGAYVALLARDRDELRRARAQLEARGAGEVITVACDVTQEGQVAEAVETVVDHFGRLDVVVNNAGLIQVGPLENMEVEDFRAAMDVHAFAALYTTWAAWPHMRRQGEGRIINIASIGGKIAVPHLAPYCASKFALVGLSDALRVELAPYGIKVTTVCPGLMRTGSPPHARVKGQHEKEYAWFATLDGMPLVSIDADRAARKIVAACRRGDAALTITPQARLAGIVNELAPETTARLLAAIARLLPEPTATAESVPGAEAESPLTGATTILSQRAAARNNE